MPNDKDRDEPLFRGGTLGDRFADAGHAARPDPMPLQGGGHRKKPGCSLFGVAMLALLAFVGSPIALSAGYGVEYIALAGSMMGAYELMVRAAT